MIRIIKITLAFIFLNTTLTSCGGEVGKVLRNEKVNTTDAFLIKKRDPLTQPPDFDKIPTPKSLSQKSKEKNELESILNLPDEKDTAKESSSTSAEQLILRELNKWKIV